MTTRRLTGMRRAQIGAEQGKLEWGCPEVWQKTHPQRRNLTEGGPAAPTSGLAAAARDRDLARAGHLDQAERAHHALERLDLLPGARDLDDHGAAGDVDDLAAEDLHDLHDLAAARAVGGDLEQRELARDGLRRLEVADLDHVDELVQLLGDLVDRVHRPVERERDARERLYVGRADGERVDVEAAAGEQPGDPGQDARLVLHQDREDVLAARPHAGGGLELLEGERLLGPWLAHASAHHLAGGGAGRDHRVGVLLARHAHVHDHWALGLERGLDVRDERRLVRQAHARGPV